MATISSIGIGSGLDIEGVITQLVAVERAPVTKLQQEATSLQTRLSTYGKLQSGMAALRDAASALTRSSTWTATVGSSSDAASGAPGSMAAARQMRSHEVTTAARCPWSAIASTIVGTWVRPHSFVVQCTARAPENISV